MKVVLLAGGFGTRLSELTDVIPKPMVTVGGRPILWHIMNWYASFGFSDYVCCLGYKANVIKEFFLNYHAMTSDFTVDLKTGDVCRTGGDTVDWKVTLVNTGQDTMTGGRVKRIKEHVGNERFLLTYGDGLSNVDINALIDHHERSGKMITVTAVRPIARFGELSIEGDSVVDFKEKPQSVGGWINGGYMVVEPEFFELIADDDTVLEREPLEAAAKAGQLNAYKHSGYWQCMDTKRDRDLLESIWSAGDAPWKS